jgi:hypothetical protein
MDGGTESAIMSKESLSLVASGTMTPTVGMMMVVVVVVVVVVVISKSLCKPCNIYHVCSDTFP